jgi:hypothetical protein
VDPIFGRVSAPSDDQNSIARKERSVARKENGTGVFGKHFFGLETNSSAPQHSR